MTTTATGPTAGACAHTITREHVVSAAGRVLFRGTHQACFDFAVAHDASCTISTAPEHARTWPECAAVPYEADPLFLRIVTEGGFARSWAGHE